MHNLKELFNYYFTGNDVFDTLFNYDNLLSGGFRKFVNAKHFTYDSDLFNSCLTRFAAKYNKTGSFFITSNEPEKHNVKVNNEFDPESLCNVIENEAMALRYVTTYIFDIDRKWCIYFDNDLDCFISWCDRSVVIFFDDLFSIPNDIFYRENNKDNYLETVINRLSYKDEFNYEQLKNAVVSKNLDLFRVE